MVAIPNAISGNRTIWQQSPTITALGLRKILLKSFSVRERPMPRVMMARVTGRKISEKSDCICEGKSNNLNQVKIAANSMKK
jgi:hypothetical protein